MKKTNVCGIIGICTGWYVPIAGIVLGLIALSRKENKELGILSITIGIIAWIFWTLSYL